MQPTAAWRYMIVRAIVDMVRARVEHYDRVPQHALWRHRAVMTVDGILTTEHSMFVNLHAVSRRVRYAPDPGTAFSTSFRGMAHGADQQPYDVCTRCVR